MIKGVIFDLDGVLVDSEPAWRWAQDAVFGEMGLALTGAMKSETTGMGMDEAMSRWRAWFPGTELDQVRIQGRLVALVLERIGESGEAMPGAREALELCRGLGLRLALASSSTLFFIRTVLEKLGFTGYFQALASAETEAHGKPHPAVYLSAARALGLHPAECVAIEDSLNGIRSAKAAGMRCIAVPEAGSRGLPAFAIADRILPGLKSLSEEFLRG